MSANNETFGGAEMARALGDITNTQPATQSGDNPLNGGPGAAGWVPKANYNYALYNAADRGSRQAADEAANVPAWAANAKKYEWSDEYGDVGPAHPELEKQLFGDEHLMRSGDQFEKSEQPTSVGLRQANMSPTGSARSRYSKKARSSSRHVVV